MAQMQQSRFDGRTVDALRKLSCEQGMLQGSMGSAQWQQGGSIVVAAVYGPAQPRYARLERHEECSVEVQFSSSSFGLRMAGALFLNEVAAADSAEASASSSSSKNSVSAAAGVLEITPPERNKVRYERDVGAALRRTVQQCVMLERFPRQLLVVSCYMLVDDGAALACAINALSLALMNAGLPMRRCAAAVAVSQLAGEGFPLYVDPLLAEEVPRRVRYMATLAFASASDGDDGELLLARAHGCMGAEELPCAVRAARAAARVVATFMRLAIKETYHRP